jgi:hypothetical protein
MAQDGRRCPICAHDFDSEERWMKHIVDEHDAHVVPMEDGPPTEEPGSEPTVTYVGSREPKGTPDKPN